MPADVSGQAGLSSSAERPQPQAAHTTAAVTSVHARQRSCGSNARRQCRCIGDAPANTHAPAPADGQRARGCRLRVTRASTPNTKAGAARQPSAAGQNMPERRGMRDITACEASAALPQRFVKRALASRARHASGACSERRARKDAQPARCSRRGGSENRAASCKRALTVSRALMGGCSALLRCSDA